MRAERPSPWFPRRTSRPDARAVLFCVPHGGAGASAFRRWANETDDDVDVVPVQLPGRESRVREALEPDLVAVAEQCLPDLQGRAAGRPVLLFGHSMGALVAYELTVMLAGCGEPPVRLVVSASTPPGMRSRLSELVDGDDDGFMTGVVGLGGVSQQVVEAPGWRELLLPVLRNDFLACAAYADVSRPVVDVPVTAVAGLDDPWVDVELMARWQAVTTAPLEVIGVPGSHLFAFDLSSGCRELVLERARQAARTAATTGAGGSR